MFWTLLINVITQKKLKELLGEPREPFEVLAPLKTRGSPNTGKYSTLSSRNSSSWSHWGRWGSHTLLNMDKGSPTWARLITEQWLLPRSQNGSFTFMSVVYSNYTEQCIEHKMTNILHPSPWITMARFTNKSDQMSLGWPITAYYKPHIWYITRLYSHSYIYVYEASSFKNRSFWRKNICLFYDIPCRNINRCRQTMWFPFAQHSERVSCLSFEAWNSFEYLEFAEF